MKKNTLKKALSLSLCGVSVLGLTGCNSEEIDIFTKTKEIMNWEQQSNQQEVEIKINEYGTLKLKKESNYDAVNKYMYLNVAHNININNIETLEKELTTLNPTMSQEELIKTVLSKAFTQEYNKDTFELWLTEDSIIVKSDDCKLILSLIDKYYEKDVTPELQTVINKIKNTKEKYIQLLFTDSTSLESLKKIFNKEESQVQYDEGVEVFKLLNKVTLNTTKNGKTYSLNVEKEDIPNIIRDVVYSIRDNLDKFNTTFDLGFTSEEIQEAKKAFDEQELLTSINKITTSDFYKNFDFNLDIDMKFDKKSYEEKTELNLDINVPMSYWNETIKQTETTYTKLDIDVLGKTKTVNKITKNTLPKTNILKIVDTELISKEQAV